MAEINLLDRYPRSNRPIEERAKLITPEHRAIARRFDREFFDGDRLTGYGGYKYHPRFWSDTVERFMTHYGLSEEASILDVGCGKGFMLFDFKRLHPQLEVRGIDVSRYAIEHAMEEMKPFVTVADAKALPFADASFDLVVSINTVHNLELEECKTALREIQRVSRGNAFVTMDAWRDDYEKQQMLKWNLTAQTYMHVDAWKELFEEVGYTGDYYWFIAQ